MACNAQHTIYDPPDDQFRCPHCGAFQGQFYVEEPDVQSEEGCGRLHVNDELRCHSCGYGTMGDAFATFVMTKLNLKPCPTCKGQDVVADKKPGTEVEKAGHVVELWEEAKISVEQAVMETLELKGGNPLPAPMTDARIGVHDAVISAKAILKTKEDEGRTGHEQT